MCDREADVQEFSAKVEGLTEERKRNSAHIGQLNRELREADELLEKRRDYDDLLAASERTAVLAGEYKRNSK